jgi:hypothetical protein
MLRLVFYSQSMIAPSAAASDSIRPARAAARLGIASTVAAVAFSALAGGVAHAAPFAPAPEFWSPNGNESLLLGADQVGTITRAAGLSVTGVSSQFADNSKRVDPANCVGAFQPAEADAYDGSTNVTTVVIDDDRGGSAGHLIQQSVIGFADPAAAQKQFTTATTAWSQCAGRPIDVKTRSGRSNPWLIGVPAPRRNGAVQVVANLGPGVVCERAMTTRNEMVVDVMACAIGGGDAAGQAEAIATAIGDNVAKRNG